MGSTVDCFAHSKPYPPLPTHKPAVRIVDCSLCNPNPKPPLPPAGQLHAQLPRRGGWGEILPQGELAAP